jgi:hypothetical protein
MAFATTALGTNLTLIQARRQFNSLAVNWAYNSLVPNLLKLKGVKQRVSCLAMWQPEVGKSLRSSLCYSKSCLSNEIRSVPVWDGEESLLLKNVAEGRYWVVNEGDLFRLSRAFGDDWVSRSQKGLSLAVRQPAGIGPAKGQTWLVRTSAS